MLILLTLALRIVLFVVLLFVGIVSDVGVFGLFLFLSGVVAVDEDLLLEINQRACFNAFTHSNYRFGLKV